MTVRPTHWTTGIRGVHTAAMDALDQQAPADPLGEALHFLRMNGAFYCRSELSAPWGLTLPPMPGYIWFHVPTSGEALLETQNAGPAPSTRRIGPCAHGEGHALRSDAGVPAPGILDLERELISDRYEPPRGGGAPTIFLRGGALRSPGSAQRRRDSPSGDPLGAVGLASAGLVAGHSRADGRRGEIRPSGEAVITRLADYSWSTIRSGWRAIRPRRAAGSARCRTSRSVARSPSSIGSRRGSGPSPAWRASWRCRARPSLPFHGPRRRARDALRRTLAHAGRRRLAARRRGHRRPTRQLARLPLRGRVRTGVQARRRRPAGSAVRRQPSPTRPPSGEP